MKIRNKLSNYTISKCVANSTAIEDISYTSLFNISIIYYYTYYIYCTILPKCNIFVFEKERVAISVINTTWSLMGGCRYSHNSPIMAKLAKNIQESLHDIKVCMFNFDS